MHGVAVPKTENEFHKASLNDHQWVPLVTRQGIIIFRLHNNFLKVILALKRLFYMVNKNFNHSYEIPCNWAFSKKYFIFSNYCAKPLPANLYYKPKKVTNNNFKIWRIPYYIPKENDFTEKIFWFDKLWEQSKFDFFLFEFGTLNDHLGGNTLFCEVKPSCECSKLKKHHINVLDQYDLWFLLCSKVPYSHDKSKKGLKKEVLKGSINLSLYYLILKWRKSEIDYQI